MRDDDGFFFFKSASIVGVEQVLEQVPVWVKMHGVPIVVYSEDGLSLIGSKIGKKIILDAYTSSMCVDAWGPAKEDVAMSSDGFTTVVNKKKKGKKQEATQSKNIKGLKIHKPKSTFVYRPKHSQPAVNLNLGKHDEEATSTSDVKNVDSDSEIEEMYVELNATKEGSTSSEQVPNV
ncbi:hypothetical protein Tco_1014479 [Tanacetum coccineum]